MLFRRIYDDALAQASYLIGCQATGEAIVVDPLRDADLYLRAVADEGLRLLHVTETHIHADFASGSRELARRSGATLHLSREGGADWQYGFASADGARQIGEGDVIEVGNVRLEAWHTPGHTPEHLSFLVTDGAATDSPMGLLSGDFLFVGDVGRPDLLEKAAGVSGTMEAGARDLYASLQRLSGLPDHLQLWPGHGAGSACGKALGAVPSSTLGYERLVNPALQFRTEAPFVDWILSDQPEPPAYFARMKVLNREGPPLLGSLPDPGRIGGDRLEALKNEGVQLVDVRARTAFSRRHLAGSLNLPLNRSFATWAGSLLDYGQDTVLVGIDAEAAREAARMLALIGYDRVSGYLGAEVLQAGGDGPGLAEAPTVSPAEGRRLQEEGALLLDVRRATEWREGHAPDACHIHLGGLPQRIDEVPADRRTVVICHSGARSAIAQSLLLAAGRDAVNVEGGFKAWREEGLPVADPGANVESREARA